MLYINAWSPEDESYGLNDSKMAPVSVAPIVPALLRLCFYLLFFALFYTFFSFVPITLAIITYDRQTLLPLGFMQHKSILSNSPTWPSAILRRDNNKEHAGPKM